MRLNPLTRFTVKPAAQLGTSLVIPAPDDVGGSPGTSAGVVWLTETLRRTEVAELVETPFATYPQWLDFDHSCARLEPSLAVAASTLMAWGAGYRPVWLFGDHSLAFGPVRAAGQFGRKVSVFQFDAHYDRHDGYMARAGIPALTLNHANVATYIGRESSVRNLYQIGVRDDRAKEEIDEVNAEVLSGLEVGAEPEGARLWIEHRVKRAVGDGDVIVLSIDMDVLDPAIMPAVNHAIAGGPSLAELCQLMEPVALFASSIDLSELAPLNDREGLGSATALKLLIRLLEIPLVESHGDWRTVVGTVSDDVLKPRGDRFPVLVRGDGNMWEPDEVEAAVLRSTDTRELEDIFRPEVLVAACRRIREQLHDSSPPALSAANFDAAPKPSSVNRSETRRASVVPSLGIVETGVLYGAGRCVEKLAVFSPEPGALPLRLAAAARDHVAYLWCFTDPSEAGPIALEGHRGWIIWAAFSPDGQTLATASDDRTLRLWRVEDPTKKTVICRGHANWVKTVDWSPDGRSLASASQDGTMLLWNAGETRPRLVVNAHPEAVWCVSFSPDGSRLATCGEGGRVRLWDSQSGKQLQEIRVHQADVKRCQFDRDGLLWSLDITGLLVCSDANGAPLDRFPAVAPRGFEMEVNDEAGIIAVIGPRVLVLLAKADPRRVLAERSLTFLAHSISGWADGFAVAGNDEGIPLYRLTGQQPAGKVRRAGRRQ